MSSIKTPGVYVEEINTLPASVAAVSTAVPAFFGLTAFATDADGNSLTGVPTKIRSLVEYERLFGTGPGNPALSKISFDLEDKFEEVTFSDAPHPQLYESLKLFFANGGSTCYITSVGAYGVAANSAALLTLLQSTSVGVPVLENYDEPTLIVIPDAAGLSDSDMGTLHNTVLAQCAKLGDRFGILETPDQGMTSQTAFMTAIGNQHVKYGAAYGPRLQIEGSYEYTFTEINAVIEDSSSTSRVLSYFNSAGYDAMKDAEADLDKANAALDPSGLSLGTSETSWPDYYAANPGQDVNTWKGRIRIIAEMGETLLNQLNTTSAFKNETITQWLIDKCISGGTLGILMVLNYRYQEGKHLSPFAISFGTVPVASTDFNGSSHPHSNYPAGYSFNYNLSSFTTGINLIYLPHVDNTSASIPYYLRNSEAAFQELFDDVYSLLLELQNLAQLAYDGQSELLREQNSTYALIKKTIREGGIPSATTGAIAGLYVANDREQGVWKAPANVAVKGIVGLSRDIDKNEQGLMNVPSNGKAINAIRTFAGRGHLVWGARTLAGNDNEWRYVSVRRLYNFVEESVAKATAFAVFEPNNGSTWTKLRSMIENFLTGLWRDGALAGAQPEDAFFVRVGLGQTMTPEDILNGELIIEVGLAAVRPAEFIILKFSHILQES